MSDIKLFSISNNGVSEIAPESITIEKSLQHTFERNLQLLLGVTFLGSEYSTGKTHGGRIDTLGIDENGCPVIIEYKRSLNENVINQGLFYLDWLLDHKGEFELLVLKTCGKGISDSIDWTAPRLICIAGDFTKYDEHAVQQINRNIELIRYRKFGHDLLLLELVNSVSGEIIDLAESSSASSQTKTVTQLLSEADDTFKNLYDSLRQYLLTLGDDVQEKALKLYFAFRRIKNFACVELRPKSKTLSVYIKVDPDSIKLEDGFTRDVREIGHWGTGDLEITIRSMEDIQRARPLLEKSYEQS